MENNTQKLTREAVRELAEKNADELRQVAEAGGDLNQLSLEQQDKVNKFAESLSGDDAVSFVIMYAEEFDECSNISLDDLNELALAEPDEITIDEPVEIVANEPKEKAADEPKDKIAAIESKSNTGLIVGGVVAIIILLFVLLTVFS